jgi:hypothetical protein
MVTRRLAAIGLLLGLGLGCSRDVVVQPTAVFVVIDADPGVRMRARAGEVHVTVRRAPALGGAMISEHTFPLAAGGSWPLTFVVQAREGSTRVEIDAELYAMPAGPMMMASPVSFARAITAYVPNATRVLPMMFWGGCLREACMPTETCRQAVVQMPAPRDECDPASDAVLQTYAGANGYGECDMGQYRFGNSCQNYGRPNDGGAMGDAGVPSPADVGSQPDAPTADAPTVMESGMLDAGTDVATDAGPADVGFDMGPADVGIDAGSSMVDAPLVDVVNEPLLDGSIFGLN